MMKFIRKQGYKYIRESLTRNEMDVENGSFYSSQSMEAVGAVQKAMRVQKEVRHTKVHVEKFAGTEQNLNMKDWPWLVRHAT
eukprot:13143656-Heterocapsa_arctica.AAC.1